MATIVPDKEDQVQPGGPPSGRSSAREGEGDDTADGIDEPRLRSARHGKGRLIELESPQDPDQGDHDPEDDPEVERDTVDRR